jgi:hypothetical protein
MLKTLYLGNERSDWSADLTEKMRVSSSYLLYSDKNFARPTPSGGTAKREKRCISGTKVQIGQWFPIL